MAVTSGNTFDQAGVALDLAISNLNTAISAAPAGSVQLAALKTALGQTQNAAVEHYMRTGRISPAKVLSTLNVGASQLAGGPGVSGDAGAHGANLAVRITSLTTQATVAGPQQNTAVQMLAKAQYEAVQCLINASVISAAQVLSSLS